MSKASRDAKHYYKRRIELGMSANEAKHENPKLRRARVRKNQAKFRKLWGRPDRNLGDRIYREHGKRLGLKSKAEVIKFLEEQ